jgi:outer membrane receptor protein involved in Fe transport
MKRVWNLPGRHPVQSALVALCCVLVSLLSAPPVEAQGVTTGSLAGTVVDSNMQPVRGASVIAIHLPSGTSYEAATRDDGRYFIPGMRVGGPYSVTVAFDGGGGGTAFAPQTKEDVTVNLGVSTDLNFAVQSIAVQETVTVTAAVDPVFSSARTGSATSLGRQEIALLPTLNGRLSDITRLTPEASGTNGNMAGQDNRANNITVDGSTFNSSFGLGGQPGDRTSVAPISLEALEQIQVNVAPFDVRQGSFTGAGINSVTRSGTNRLTGSFYHRFRNQDWVGTEAKGQVVNPGTFTFRNTGGWAGGPIVRNKWFVFGNYEDQLDKRPLTTFRANNGGEPVGGQVTRVLASDMTALSNFLRTNFGYETGPFNNIPDETPAKRFLLRSDFNLNSGNKISFRYNYLDSFSDLLISQSSSALTGRTPGSTGFMTFQNSNYQILENIRSGIGEWNTVIGNSMSNSFQAGYTTQNESRNTRGKIFPLVDIYEGGTSYLTFGGEPFTYPNGLVYSTFQFQDNFSKFMNRHSLTFGVYSEKYHAENMFMNCCTQSAYGYNSLADFYTDANGFLANPARTVSPVSLRAFQISYSNVPGEPTPVQTLDVWYSAGYVQDEWRARPNLTVTAGVRFDTSRFTNDGFPNADADALTFRDENGTPVRYRTGQMPDPKVLWSPRVGFNWDVASDQKTQLRGGIGLFSGRPPYVWIANQLGNTGVLLGGTVPDVNAGTRFPFNPNIDTYKPATVTAGTHAPLYSLNVTDSDFKFPQTIRTNVGLDRRLPMGLVSTTELLYAKDVNGAQYINANLPAAQSTFAGVDSRPRWTGPACVSAGNVGGCATRINSEPGNVVGVNYVLKNGNQGDAWNFSQSLQKTTSFGLMVRGAYSYGISHSLSDPESTAATSFARNSQSADPNKPGKSISMWSPGPRVYAMVNYTRTYLNFGTTSVSAFWEARRATSTLSGSSRLSYVFAGDMNGDSFSANDLIYIPRDTSEMNFSPFTAGGRTFSAAEQAQAFEAYIQQDAYLSKNRGKYAERSGAALPMFRTMDLSITQDLFKNLGGTRNGFQLRVDVVNFLNLLNSNWGVSQIPVASINGNQQLQILTNPGIDAQGRSTYRLAVVNNELIKKTFQSSAALGDTRSPSDVYQFMVSLRYNFN